MRFSLSIGVALFASVSFPASSPAAIVGSASLATHRSCAATAATADCDGAGPGQAIVTQSYHGGIGVGGTNTLFVPGGNQAWSTVNFDPTTDLPIIKALTAAPGNLRMNVNTFAFQSYIYTGLVASPFSLSSDLHIVNSSTSPTGPFRPGGARYSNYVAVWNPVALAGLTTVEDLFDALFFAPCGTPGIYGAASDFGALTGGSLTSTVTTSECSPGSLTLVPGQEVLVVAGLQIPSNRGGFADGSSTFTTRLGDDLSPEVKAKLAATLVSAIDQGALVTVPEPSTWAMMLGGFGLAGAALRRRRVFGNAET